LWAGGNPELFRGSPSVLRATLETPGGVVLQPNASRSRRRTAGEFPRPFTPSCRTCYVVPALGNKLRHRHKAAFNAMPRAGSTLQTKEAAPGNLLRGGLSR